MKKVLVLNSYHVGYVWGDSVNKGITDVLSQSQMSVNFRFEFMDTKHLRPEVIFERLHELYSIKYAEFQFDVIIATDNNALNFLLLYRDQLFPNTPVVFCGINGFTSEMLAGKVGYTGFAENSDLRGTLSTALQIHPETRHVAVVSGTSTSSLINQARMKEIEPEFSHRVEFINLSRLNPVQLKRRLMNLPEKTIVFYLSYYKMEDGTFLTVQESTSFVFDSCQLPTYSPWEYTMGYGIVGGMMLSGEKEGRRAAEYALKILDGQLPGSLPVRLESDIAPIFDYNLLKQLNIPKSRLPENSTIINQPQTVYFKYKYWIWALVIFILYQTATILWLTHNLMRRKKAEKLQKQLENQLLHSQKMEAIGTFAGGIAHDLNNILGAIGTCSEIAMEDTPASSPVHEDLKHVLSATNRGKSLIRQILDFSKKQDLERQPIRMKDMVKECVNLLRQIIPPTIETKTELLTDQCTVFANPTKIHQVIMNLCTNGVQAMQGKNGTLTLRLERITIPSHYHPGLELEPGYHICITVTDTGCGMPEDIRSRIFEPFFTTRAQTEGTGLGLAVVHGIVTGYGGAITVDSEPAKGSSFHVFLPCRNEEYSMLDHQQVTAAPGGNETILLVDDDGDMLYSSKKLLERSGYKVICSDSSMAGLRLFKENLTDIQLVITDLVMPQMTGYELIEKVRELRSDMPVILSSGHTNPQVSHEKMKANNIEIFIQKPFTNNEFLNKIRQALENQGENNHM